MNPGHPDHPVMSAVRRALGRSQPLRDPPVPPAIDEPITRLVHSDFGLPELFARRAAENKIGVEQVYVGELADRLVAFLKEKQCRRMALAESKLLEKLEIPQALRSAGFEVRMWPEMVLDELYEVDCGITDAWCAVAETGSIVVQPSAGHGRALSLVPPLHIAILEPRNFVGDLVDLFEKLSHEGGASATTLITGPSKTADIEMNLVMGVHGPRVVQAFVLS